MEYQEPLNVKINVSNIEYFNLHTFPTTLLTFSRLMKYIYMSYRTANLQTLHFIYLFNKYTY
jgi:hypothetical protein